MALDAVIFDLDGTLIDTNWAHIEAWNRAFQSRGYRVAPDRIAVEIGKGGDMLVGDVLGQEAEEKDGEALRKASVEEFLAIARKTHFKPIPGAEDLLRTLRQRGMKLALATSSKVKHLDATLQSARFDVKAMVDVLVTADDAASSKPAPDLVVAACGKLGMNAAQCAMVGDTPYDAQASCKAGVVCLGVLTGNNPPNALRRAGARAVWTDAADLDAHVDDALRVASPLSGRWDEKIITQRMRETIDAARAGVSSGRPPIACLLCRGDGTVIRSSLSDGKRCLGHAPLAALIAAENETQALARDLVLVCTIDPCAMCTAAAGEAGVDMIVFGARGAPYRSQVTPPSMPGRYLPRLVGPTLEREVGELLARSRNTRHLSHRQPDGSSPATQPGDRLK